MAKNSNENKNEQKEEAIAEVKKENKKDSIVNEIQPTQVVASAEITHTDKDEYQSFRSVVNKKIRSVLGIKPSTECETQDKITAWELAMAAKSGMQKLIGTKALDVNKVCDGTGENVEYVFVAGNFEITKNSSK